MFQLRPYQQEAVDIAVKKLLKGDKPFIELLATGAGKSLVIASIASRLNGPVLVLQPSKEILEQNFNKLLALGIKDAAIYSASFNSKVIDRFTYATIGSIKNYALFAHFKYIIIDEADLVNPKGIESMYMKFFSAIKPIGIMGLTATPYRRVSKYYKDGHDLYYTSGMEMLNRIHPFFFTSIAYKIELRELISMGFLSPIKYYVQNADNKKLKVNTIGSDYTDKSLQIVSTERQSKTIQAILYADKTCVRSITFVPSVANARQITENLKQFNVRCPTISAETPAKERASLLKDYRKGNFKHLINVGVFLVGLDVPEIDAIIWDRNTVHPRILYQGIGRGLRLDPKRPDKVLHVYDVSGSLFKTGAIEDFRVVKEDSFKDKLIGRVNGTIKTISGVPLFVQKLN